MNIFQEVKCHAILVLDEKTGDFMNLQEFNSGPRVDRLGGERSQQSGHP